MEERTEHTQLPVYNLDYSLIRTYEDSFLKEEIKDKDGKNRTEIKMDYVEITPNEKYVVCGYASGHITLFDYETGDVVKSFKAHDGKVIHIEFYEPENLMFTCGADGKIQIFDIKNFLSVNEIIQPITDSYSHLREIRFVLISDNAEHIYFGSNNGCLYKCDKKSNYKPYIFVSPYDMYPEQLYYLTSGVFSPDKKYLVFASGYSLKFVNLETGKVEKIIGKTKHYINDVIFYPFDDKIVTTWSEDGTITYWNIETEEELISFSASKYSGYSHLSFDKTGQYLASGNDGNFVNVWDAVTKHLLVKIEGKISMDNKQQGHKGIIKKMLFTKDNNLLTASKDGTVKLWKLTKK